MNKVLARLIIYRKDIFPDVSEVHSEQGFNAITFGNLKTFVDKNFSHIMKSFRISTTRNFATLGYNSRITFETVRDEQYIFDVDCRFDSINIVNAPWPA